MILEINIDLFMIRLSFKLFTFPVENPPAFLGMFWSMATGLSLFMLVWEK